MEGSRRFGMATVDPRTGRLRRVGCEAEVLECQPQPDGRFYLEIVGRRRFRVDATLATLKWESARLQDLFVGERAIELASVVGVVEGISTDLLRRKLACGEIFGGHANRFFSLVMPDRSVDLEASSSAQAKVLARAFRFLSEARNRGGAMAMGFGGGSPTWR